MLGIETERQSTLGDVALYQPPLEVGVQSAHKVIKTRRFLVLVCIAVLLVTAMSPAAAWAAPNRSPMWSSVSSVAASAPASPTADLVFDVVASLGLLFLAVISVPLHQAEGGDVGTAPFLSVRGSRGPPIA
jgi:hypothetical protein